MSPIGNPLSLTCPDVELAAMSSAGQHPRCEYLAEEKQMSPGGSEGSRRTPDSKNGVDSPPSSGSPPSSFSIFRPWLSGSSPPGTTSPPSYRRKIFFFPDVAICLQSCPYLGSFICFALNEKT